VKDYEGLGQGQVQIIINQGDDGATIAKTLFDKGVIASERAFLLETYDNPTGALKIQPGYYILAREMKAEYVLGMLIDPGERRLHKDFQVIPGDRLTEIFQNIANQGGFSLEEVQLAAEDTVALGLPAEAGGNLEGWLAADKFIFNPDVHPADVLTAMIRQTVTVLEDLNVPPANWEDTLKLASIVAGEAGSNADMPYVARIFLNRLAIPMSLQSCATIVYIFPGTVIPTNDQLLVDDPYNTYKYGGLPPGPINSPGEAAIKAVIAPAEGDYLYMTTINLETGETIFETSLTEHDENAAIIHQWCKDNPEYHCDNG
jgi:UPF0755 protein